MSFEVRVFDPWVSRVKPGGGADEVPVSALRDTDAHIHGELAVIVGGEPLPHLGYFGPRDVCLGTWIHGLCEARRALLAGNQTCHIFDEGEQGQPAFKFVRLGDRVEVSIVDSEIGDGIGDPDWGIQTCTLREFDQGIAAFLVDLSVTLEAAAPGVGKSWVYGRAGSG